MKGDEDPSATGNPRDFTVAGSMRLIDVTRDVVRVEAPEELPLLAGLEHLDDTEILRRLKRRAKFGPLGFGMGEKVLVTLIVWVAVHDTADEMAKAEDMLRARGGVHRRWSFNLLPEPLPRFGETELQVVRARAIELARDAGMEAAPAERLADAIVGRLTPRDDGPQISQGERREPAPDSTGHGDGHVAYLVDGHIVYSVEDLAEHLRRTALRRWAAPRLPWGRRMLGGRAGLGEAVFPVTVYLSDERIHHQVEAAVDEFLASAGLRIEDRGEPVFGSFFRRSRAVAREGALVGMHLADQRLVLAQDAAVTATLLQNLAPVIASLQPTKDAQLRVGALLIVKVDWVVNVFQLTAAQQAKLDHQPQLALSPHEIVAALDLTPPSHNGDSPPGLQ